MFQSPAQERCGACDLCGPDPAPSLGVCGEFAGDITTGPSDGVDASSVEDVADLANVLGCFQRWDVSNQLSGAALQLDWARGGFLCVLWLARSRVRVRW